MLNIIISIVGLVLLCSVIAGVVTLCVWLYCILPGVSCYPDYGDIFFFTGYIVCSVVGVFGFIVMFFGLTKWLTDPTNLGTIAAIVGIISGLIGIFTFIRTMSK
jgi:hypothetical protein